MQCGIITFFVLFLVSWLLCEGASVVAPLVVDPPETKTRPERENGVYGLNQLHQYSNVKYPGVFEWGYRRGNPLNHIRSQIFNQKGAIFNSVVSFSFFSKSMSKNSKNTFISA